MENEEEQDVEEQENTIVLSKFVASHAHSHSQSTPQLRPHSHSHRQEISSSSSGRSSAKKSYLKNKRGSGSAKFVVAVDFDWR